MPATAPAADRRSEEVSPEAGEAHIEAIRFDGYRVVECGRARGHHGEREPLAESPESLVVEGRRLWEALGLRCQGRPLRRVRKIRNWERVLVHGCPCSLLLLLMPSPPLLFRAKLVVSSRLNEFDFGTPTSCGRGLVVWAGAPDSKARATGTHDPAVPATVLSATVLAQRRHCYRLLSFRVRLLAHIIILLVSLPCLFRRVSERGDKESRLGHVIG